ncbi:MAG TPA: hypothetical protein VMH83_00835, partial [Candidatus Acidoferrum sp.]|nr:hypothetical protein [Candidatus Acidoferrum sp.]
MLLLVGVAVYVAAIKQLVESNTLWFYSSEGVIKPGEHYRQFDAGPINEIHESKEEWEKRLQDNRIRIDRTYFES